MSPLKVALVLEAVNNMSRPLEQAEKSVGRLGTAVEKTARLSDRLRGLQEGAERMGRSALTMGAVGAAAVGKTVQAFTRLEDAQAAAKNAFSTIEGIDKAWDSINKQALKAGDLYPGTTADFINMAAAMKSMGMEAATIEGGAFAGASALKVMFKLDPAEAGQKFVQLGNAMGIASRDSMAFSDTLQRTAYTSGLSIHEMADAMSYMATPLKSYGVQGLEAAQKVSVMMGVLKKSGLNGSMIGSAFMGAFDAIAKIGPKMDYARGGINKEAVSAIKKNELDLQFFDKGGKFSGIENMMIQFDKISNLKNDQEKKLIASAFFGAEGARMVEQMTLKGYREKAIAMSQQENITARLARITATLGNKMEATAGTAENVAANFAEKIGPALGTVFDKVNTLLSSIGKWIDKHPVLTRNIGLTLVGLSAFLVVVGGAGLVVGKLTAGLLGAASAFGSVMSFTGKAGIAIWDAGRAIATFSRLSGSLSGGLAAWSRMQFPWLHSMGGHLGTAGRAIGGFSRAIWANITAAGAWAKALLLHPVQTIRYAANAAWSSMVKLATAVWSNVTAAGAWAKASLLSSLQGLRNMGTAAAASVAKLVPIVLANATAAWAWTTAMLANPLTWVVVGVVALGAAGYLLIKHWTRVKGFFSGLWGWLKAKFNAASTWALLAVPLIGPVLAIVKHWDKLKEGFGALWSWIKGMGGRFKEAGSNIMKSIWEGMKAACNLPVEAIQGVVEKIRRFLPFSPAKEGPLKDLHRVRIIETVAEGIKPAALAEKMHAAAGLGMNALKPAALSLALALPAQTTAARSTVQLPAITAQATMPRVIVPEIRAAAATPRVELPHIQAQVATPRVMVPEIRAAAMPRVEPPQLKAQAAMPRVIIPEIRAMAAQPMIAMPIIRAAAATPRVELPRIQAQAAAPRVIVPEIRAAAMQPDSMRPSPAQSPSKPNQSITINLTQNITMPTNAKPGDKQVWLDMARSCAPELARQLRAELSRLENRGAF